MLSYGSKQPVRRGAALSVAVAGAVVLAAALPASAAGGSIDLGSTSTYGVLGAASISNTGPTEIWGDLGLSPATKDSIQENQKITMHGSVHAGDPEAAQAQLDLGTAYDAAKALSSTTVAAPEIGATTTPPGVYSSKSQLLVSGNLILDGGGDPNAVWVFQAGTALIAQTGSTITLIGGAQACNVYWQVGSSATLDVGSTFVGTIMAQESIAAKTKSTVQGRLLARTGSVTLESNTITVPDLCPPAADPGPGPGGVEAGGVAGPGDPGDPGVPAAAVDLPTLAFTGTSPTPLVLGGGALLALGGAAWVFAMRPRTGHGRRALRG